MCASSRHAGSRGPTPGSAASVQALPLPAAFALHPSRRDASACGEAASVCAELSGTGLRLLAEAAAAAAYAQAPTGNAPHVKPCTTSASHHHPCTCPNTTGSLVAKQVAFRRDWGGGAAIRGHDSHMYADGCARGVDCHCSALRRLQLGHPEVHQSAAAATWLQLSGG